MTRLGSALSVMTACGDGALMCTPASLFVPRHPLISWWLVIPPVHLSVVSQMPLRPCRFLCVPWRSFFSLPATVVVLCLPPAGVVTPEVACLHTGPARWSSVVSWCGGGGTSRPECPYTCLPEPGECPSHHTRCLQLEGLIKGLA